MESIENMSEEVIRKEINKARNEAGESSPGIYFDEKRFIPKRLADEIMEEYSFKTHADTLYYYDNGVYRFAYELVKRIVSNKLVDTRTINRFNETIDYIKSVTTGECEELPIYYINLKNGLFNLETETLEPHDPKYFTITQIPVHYEPSAICFEFQNILSEILDKSDIPIIQELFGYCLYRDYPIHKAFMFIGDGANGKSTLINILRLFVGRENCSNVPLQYLGEKFYTIGLYGKMVNYYSDLSSKAFTKTGTFKILTGQDYLEAHRKFKDSFQFMNFAKLVFSCNKLPLVSGDDSDAFYRRWVFINFPNKFEGKNADRDILNKVNNALELSGLLNWALEGLKRLLEESAFSHSKTTDDLRTQYQRLSSPVKSFIQDMIIKDSDSHEIKQKLYTAFVGYCNRENIPTSSNKKFSMDMNQEGFETCQITINKKRQWCFKGLKFKKNEENEPDDVDLSNYMPETE